MPRITLRGDFINKVYKPYLQDTTRYQLFFGGAGSGKSVFLATRCLLDALSGRNTLVVRQVARTLKGSCWNEICKAMDRLGLNALFTLSKTDMTITCRLNSAQILFAGLDDAEKIKSLTPRRGALTDIWMEEATECAYRDFKQLDKRLRGRSPHPKRVTLSFNPTLRGHWIEREFFSRWRDDQTAFRSDTVSILRTTYRDNRFLTAEDRAALENEKDPYFFQVYTQGRWGALGNEVFTNWRVENLPSPVPGETRLGLDFGFAADPCGFVRVQYDRKARRVYVLEEFRQKGLTNLALSRRLVPYAALGSIACDSAEPKSIAELRSLGCRVHPVKKGPDSILHGIQWLRQQEIILSPDCPKLREELSHYQWQQDRDGCALPRPLDRDNHLIDALRYALAQDMENRFAFTASRKALGL